MHLKWLQLLLQTLLHNLDQVWTTSLMTTVHCSAKYNAKYELIYENCAYILTNTEPNTLPITFTNT